MFFSLVQCFVIWYKLFQYYTLFIIHLIVNNCENGISVNLIHLDLLAWENTFAVY